MADVGKLGGMLFGGVVSIEKDDGRIVFMSRFCSSRISRRWADAIVFVSSNGSLLARATSRFL